MVFEERQRQYMLRLMRCTEVGARSLEVFEVMPGYSGSDHTAAVVVSLCRGKSILYFTWILLSTLARHANYDTDHYPME